MANRRQRQRKLARAQFHQQQSHDRNRRLGTLGGDTRFTERRSAVIDQPATRHDQLKELQGMTRDALRQIAADRKIRGRSIMTKDALIKALMS